MSNDEPHIAETPSTAWELRKARMLWGGVGIICGAIAGWLTILHILHIHYDDGGDVIYFGLLFGGACIGRKYGTLRFSRR
jgi:hypothetical protein